MSLGNILNFILIRLSLEVVQYAPVWITSSYLKAGTSNIITTITGNTQTPTATIPFSSPFTSIPNLGYGASTYLGNDSQVEEMFEINRTGLTTSSFSVLVQISGTTNINYLTVRFIAVDVLFPHSLNSYDNVPVNYSAGPLTNISVKGTTAFPSIYTNTINFTQQSASFQYKYFSTPLSSNKILLFLTSYFHQGTGESPSTTGTPVPLTFLIDYEILTTETYKLKVSLGIKNLFQKLHFSMIIFDQVDVEQSGTYLMIYERINVPYTGGFLPLPVQFLDNYIIAFTNLTTNRTRSQLLFSWTYINNSGVYGYYMPSQTSTRVDLNPVVTIGFSYFYLKTWFCPNASFFDPSLDLCTTCPIVNCKDCYNLTVCWLCDEENGYFRNSSTGKCDYCIMAGCGNCTIVSQNTLNLTSYTYQQVCNECNITLGYELLNDGTCNRCQNEFNIFLNPSTLRCETCTIPHCTNCLNLTSCALCDVGNSYGFDPMGTGCVLCDNTANYFVNMTSYECNLCTLEGCMTCSSLTECLSCNATGGYSLNLTSNLCQLCLMANCFLCTNQTSCTVCISGYAVNITSGQCELCPPGGCNSNNNNNNNFLQNADIQVKKKDCNQFSVTIKLQDTGINQLLTSQSVRIFNKQVQVTDTTINLEYIQLLATYNESIQEPINIWLMGEEKNVTYSQIFPYLYYTSDQCRTQNNIKNLMDGILIFSYILLFVSLFSCKIIGLEMFGVLQLSYFALIQHDFVNFYLQPLTSLRMFNGLNVKILEDYSKLPESFEIIGQNANFLNNCNIMYFAMILQLILSFVLWVIYKISKSERLREISLRLMKQGFITFLLFNFYNLSFSTGSHLSYAEPGPSYWIGILMIVLFMVLLIGSILGLIFSEQEQYGQFIKKFKNNTTCKLYIPFSLLYRFGVGLYISTTSLHIESTLISLAFIFIFMMYNGSWLPFKNVYQNYRSHLIYITELIILLTSNYYRSMKANTPLSVKGKLFSLAIIQIIMILSCIFISTALLIYEIYHDIKKCYNGRKIRTNEHRPTQEAIQASLQIIQ